MSDNEMQSIDLVVGPLENFDDAVAFGDALYGLEGVTRLALNEFEGQRASFTFTARSLESVTASLAGMFEFPISAIESAVDGTLQVRLGAAATAAPIMVEEASFAEPQAYEAPPEPSVDPFVPEPRFEPAPPPVEEPWTPAPEVALQAQPTSDFGLPAEAPAPAAFTEDFGQPEPVEMAAQPEAMPDPQPSAWPGDQILVDAEPTPLFPETTVMEEPAAQQDDASEVARVIEKLASELRETAQHLTALAAGLTSAAEHESAPQAPAEETSQWQDIQAGQADMGWAEELPAESTIETPVDFSAASHLQQAPEGPPADSWQAPAASAPETELTTEDEPKAWEAPRMPAVGAMAPLAADGPPNEFMNEAHSAQAIALATAAGRRPSQVQLMASGFASFGIANSFIAAVRQIPGVRNVAIIELDQGRLKLTLDYFGSDSLEAQLQQLRDFPHQVVRASSKEIEIQLMAA